MVYKVVYKKSSIYEVYEKSHIKSYSNLFCCDIVAYHCWCFKISSKPPWSQGNRIVIVTAVVSLNVSSRILPNLKKNMDTTMQTLQNWKITKYFKPTLLSTSNWFINITVQVSHMSYLIYFFYVIHFIHKLFLRFMY